VATANPQNPLSFDTDEAEFSFGVQFRAPLDQIAEQNAYRTSLINYQRARRSYMLFEDQVKQQVRRALRAMLVAERNLETARGAGAGGGMPQLFRGLAGTHRARRSRQPMPKSAASATSGPHRCPRHTRIGRRG